jgi:uncharacterized membrane-anchored protein YitT (DUF2179 family)
MLKKIIDKIKSLGFKSILMMHVGLICCAISTVIFLTPSRMVVSGATGLALFIGIITNLQEHYYIFLYAINGILLIISYFTLGKEFTFKTIYGALMLPTFGMIITEIINIFNIDIIHIVGNVEPVFVVLFASFLMGVGIGLNMKNGGSTGGFDIIEALLFKYFHIPYSTSIYTLDAILVILGMITYDASLPNSLFANSFSEGLGATIYIFILGFVVDMITFGGYNKRAVFIRSYKYEDIHDAIINKLIRGVTYLNAEGGYSQDKTKVILCICYSKEYFRLRNMVQEIDPMAFMFVMKATEVRGLGFNFETPEHIERHKKKRVS